MVKPHVVSSMEALAHGARIAKIETFCHYHTQFALDTAKTLLHTHPCNVLESTTFSGSLNAAMGASLAGKRSFVVSSIPKSVQDIYTAAYMRLPVVIGNISRPLGAFSFGQDHSDIMALRDAGCLIFMPENNLDAMECIIQAYKVCEDPKVMLPAVVNIDMPFFSETLELPSDQYVKRFLGSAPQHIRLDGRKHLHFGMPGNHDEYKKQQQKAMKNALEVIEKTSLTWKTKFRKLLPAVESYKAEDADYLIIIAGYHSTTAKAAVNRMRAEGKKVGLVRLRIIRPWPADAIKNAIKNCKKVAVFDQSAAIGTAGALYSDVKMIVPFASDFISLGRHMSEKDFMDIFTRLEKIDKEEVVWL